MCEVRNYSHTDIIICDQFQMKPYWIRRGLVIRRHNEIRDCLGDMAALVWSQVIKEPVVREGDPAANDPGLRLDLGICGVWQPQVEALLDIWVIDTN